MKRMFVVLFTVSGLGGSLLVSAAELARADATCTETAQAGAPLKLFLETVSAEVGGLGGVACLSGGTYTLRASIVPPPAITVVGVGLDPVVIDCASAVYCFKGSAGPDDVTLRDISLDGAQKADIQIGSAGSALVQGWVLDRVTATGAGQVGIAINHAANITVSGSTIERNGSTPYDSVTNPTGDFGLRAVNVDGLTVEGSFFYDNPTVAGLDLEPGFAGGAKFNTDTNLVVRANQFKGNAGGAQLWIDIDSRGFQISGNAIEQAVNAVSGELPNAAIRVEVSCNGPGGSSIHDNTVTGGVVAAIDLFDSHGITVADNDITVRHATKPNWGIRMLGNKHPPVPARDCELGGGYPNEDNFAIGNRIDMVSTGNALNGVKNTGEGTSVRNNWSGNTYTMRHCDGQQWSWWDGAANQGRDYADWQGIGQDDDADSTCTSIYPEITSFVPARGLAGSTVTISGIALAGAISLRFDNTQALFQQVSDSEITATVPDGATTGPICVTTPVQGWCTTEDFTVAPDPPAAPVIVSPVTRFQLAPFSATWAPSEGATGYDVQWRSASFHGGFPATWHEATTTDTSLALPFHAGDTVCFLITAFNDGGSSPGSEGCTAAPVDDRALRVSGGSWTRTRAPRHYRGTATTSKAQGSTLVLEGIETRAICLIVEDHPDGGVVDLLWNGRLLRRISTDGPAGRRCVGIRPWVPLHDGIVTIRVHSSGKSVVIDGLGLSRV